MSKLEDSAKLEDSVAVVAKEKRRLEEVAKLVLSSSKRPKDRSGESVGAGAGGSARSRGRGQEKIL